MLADITMVIYAFLLNSAIVSTISRIPRTIWGPVDAQNPPANPIPPPPARRRAELNTTLPKPFGPLPLGKRQVPTPVVSHQGPLSQTVPDPWHLWWLSTIALKPALTGKCNPLPPPSERDGLGTNKKHFGQFATSRTTCTTVA